MMPPRKIMRQYTAARLVAYAVESSSIYRSEEEQAWLERNALLNAADGKYRV